MNKSKYLIVIGGPTASGKSAIALKLAKELDCSIISADSRQVYKKLNIGTDKPSSQTLSLVKHYMVDILSPDEEYSVSQFEEDVLQILEKEFQEKDVVILAGGTGLYIKAVLEGLDDIPKSSDESKAYFDHLFLQGGITTLQDELKERDPAYYGQVDLNNSRRLIRALCVHRDTGKTYSSFLTGTKKKRPWVTLKLYLDLPREELYNKINTRVDQMMETGLIDEVKKLEEYQEYNSLNTLAYVELFEFLSGEISMEEAIDRIKQNTRRFAKRQVTWFKKYFSGKHYHPKEYSGIEEYIKNCLPQASD